MEPFRKNERDALVIILIAIIAAIVLMPYIDDIVGTSDEPSKVSSLLKQKHFKDKRQQDSSRSNSPYYAVEETTYELFPFDPNTADSTQLLRLGLQPWQVRSIYRYRAKGGIYRKPTDFARLYGLTAEHYHRLEPYIKIKPIAMAADVYASNDNTPPHATPDSKEPQHNDDATTGTTPKSSIFVTKIKPGEHININTADTTLLKKIPGIGSFYARKIVQRRQSLGGFYSPQQLLEIDGFPEESLQYMTVGNISANGLPDGVAQIMINKSTVKELSRHPYLRYIQAKQIDEYRRQVKPFDSAGELRNIPSLTQTDIKRMTPYLNFSK